VTILVPATRAPRTMPSIEAVFLDLGNVLAFHDDPVLFQRLSAWGGADPEIIHQGMLALWDSINRGSLAGDDLRRTVCRLAGSDAPMDPEAFFELWNCCFRIHHEVWPTVDALIGKVKVLLLSNTNEIHWRYLEQIFPQFSRFDDLVLSHQLRLAKPDPEIFQVALRRAGVRPEHAAYFDDVPRFVDAACALGIHGRVFTDAQTFRTQLAELGLTI
jgi:HAD superfamily hydrolase (TIGR01509 family)